MKNIVSFCVCLLIAGCGFHHPEIRVLPSANHEHPRVLFIAFDGIAYDMMAELHAEGYFADFQEPIPLIVTFPSDTTVGFTGIFRPLKAGLVPGYETRFFSFKDNKVIGGTPWDIYKILISYKTYFDSFRHTMFEKAIMYALPGVAGKQDLLHIQTLVHKTNKNILFAYLGGTDGAQHILGKNRTRRFMIFVDRFLKKMKSDYAKKNRGPLRIVLFSDHGFHYSKLKMVSTGQIGLALKAGGLQLAHHLNDPKDVVLVKYGLLSSGVAMTHSTQKEKAARLIHGIQGMDLTFWDEGNRIYILSPEAGEAYFEYQGINRHRYVPVTGDPLGLVDLLKKKGHRPGEWLDAASWFSLTWNHLYPDAGYRLYDAFHGLVENSASVLFSLKPPYQFGGMAALAGTKLKLGGHKGTHGGLFRDVTQGVVMTDDFSVNLPLALRYDQFFHKFLPHVVKAYH